MLLTGAKPVPPATKMIGLSLSSRRKKNAVRPFEAQQGLFLQMVEHEMGELAVWHQADVQLQELVVVRRVGERKAAALVARQQNVDVLAGKELQALVGRQRQVQHHHIGRHFLHPRHPRRQGAQWDVLRHARLMALDGDIRQRLRAAEQRQPGLPLFPAQRCFLIDAIIDGPLQHPPPAHPALAAAAGVGHRETRAQRGFQDGFALTRGVSVVAGFEGDLESHV